MENRTYIAIDLKSFYASVECVDRHLDPLRTNLVVADVSRTEKTICLAVTPSLKSYGISGRARLFEVVSAVQKINNRRLSRAPGGCFKGSSYDNPLLLENPSMKLDYIAAPPRMARYMKVSTQIFKIYLNHVSAQDLIVYSVDEVFIDATPYLKTSGLDARGFAMMLVRDVFYQTGITATAGIGTNLFLSKIAMDIVAKHIPPDENGVRIAELDEMSFRKKLWTHTPITDFWRIGPATAKSLMSRGLYTMGDIARTSIKHEEVLYRLFGVNAGLLIDHAWGYEPCTVEAVKNYKPATRSVGTSQVLHCPYEFEKACIVLKEMADGIALDLVSKHFVTPLISVYVNYDRCNLSDPSIMEKYNGPVSTDWYGRPAPKSVHASLRLDFHTSSSREIVTAAEKLFRKIADPCLLIRRLSITACNVVDENSPIASNVPIQMDLFCDFEKNEEEMQKKKEALEREKRGQIAVLEIKKKYGKNAIIRGTDLMDGATAVQRNSQIGGHMA